MPALPVYILAGVATVGVIIVFKEFVYDPHIAPKVDRIIDEFQANRCRRRQQERLHAVPVSLSRRGRDHNASDQSQSSDDSYSDDDDVKGQPRVVRQPTEWETKQGQNLRQRRQPQAGKARVDDADSDVDRYGPPHVSSPKTASGGIQQPRYQVYRRASERGMARNDIELEDLVAREMREWGSSSSFGAKPARGALDEKNQALAFVPLTPTRSSSARNATGSPSQRPLNSPSLPTMQTMAPTISRSNSSATNVASNNPSSTSATGAPRLPAFPKVPNHSPSSRANVDAEPLDPVTLSTTIRNLPSVPRAVPGIRPGRSTVASPPLPPLPPPALRFSPEDLSKDLPLPPGLDVSGSLGRRTPSDDGSNKGTRQGGASAYVTANATPVDTSQALPTEQPCADNVVPKTPPSPVVESVPLPPSAAPSPPDLSPSIIASRSFEATSGTGSTSPPSSQDGLLSKMKSNPSLEALSPASSESSPPLASPLLFSKASASPAERIALNLPSNPPSSSESLIPSPSSPVSSTGERQSSYSPEVSNSSPSSSASPPARPLVTDEPEASRLLSPIAFAQASPSPPEQEAAVQPPLSSSSTPARLASPHTLSALSTPVSQPPSLTSSPRLPLPSLSQMYYTPQELLEYEHGVVLLSPPSSRSESPFSVVSIGSGGALGSPWVGGVSARPSRRTNPDSAMGSPNVGFSEGGLGRRVALASPVGVSHGEENLDASRYLSLPSSTQGSPVLAPSSPPRVPESVYFDASYPHLAHPVPSRRSEEEIPGVTDAPVFNLSSTQGTIRRATGESKPTILTATTTDSQSAQGSSSEAQNPFTDPVRPGTPETPTTKRHDLPRVSSATLDQWDDLGHRQHQSAVDDDVMSDSGLSEASSLSSWASLADDEFN